MYCPQKVSFSARIIIYNPKKDFWFQMLWLDFFYWKIIILLILFHWQFEKHQVQFNLINYRNYGQTLLFVEGLNPDSMIFTADPELVNAITIEDNHSFYNRRVSYLNRQQQKTLLLMIWNELFWESFKAFESTDMVKNMLMLSKN